MTLIKEAMGIETFPADNTSKILATKYEYFF